MRKFAIGLLLASLVARPANAQSNPQTRQGFWINFGMGGTLSQKLIIGGELNCWS